MEIWSKGGCGRRTVPSHIRGVYLQLYVALLQFVSVRLEFDVGQLVRGRRRLEIRVEQRIHQRGLAQTGLA